MKTKLFLIISIFLFSSFSFAADKNGGFDFSAKNIPADVKLLLQANYAIQTGDIRALDRAIKKGANLNSDKFNLLFMAISTGQLTMVNFLIRKGADVNFKDSPFGETPLHHAARAGQLIIAKRLVAKGAKVKAVDAIGATPLHSVFIASATSTNRGLNNNTLAGFLLKKGADINAQDQAGNTPLHYAASTHNISGAAFLLGKKAQINIKNNNRYTPLDSAEFTVRYSGLNPQDALVRMLEKSRAKRSENKIPMKKDGSRL